MNAQKEGHNEKSVRDQISMRNISMRASILLLFFAAIVLIFTACGQNSNAALLKVKVASLPACGSTAPTIALVKEAAKELNLQIDFEYVPITTIDQAVEHRHLGSPTIQINGLDIDPAVRSIKRYGIS